MTSRALRPHATAPTNTYPFNMQWLWLKRRWPRPLLESGMTDSHGSKAARPNVLHRLRTWRPLQFITPLHKKLAMAKSPANPTLPPPKTINEQIKKPFRNEDMRNTSPSRLRTHTSQGIAPCYGHTCYIMYIYFIKIDRQIR